MSIAKLSDQAAVMALSMVAEEWLRQRGLEAHVVIDGARKRTPESYDAVPSWAGDIPTVTAESGDFARRMLAALRSGADEEVSVWTERAIDEVSQAKGHVVEPLSLAIGGVILIGAILAARVKKMGSVEFYEGVPKELADVMKAAGAGAPTISTGGD